MSQSLRDLTLEALSFIASTASGSNDGTIALASAPQKSRIAADMAAVAQRIYKLPSLYRRTLGAVLAAPSTITVTTTDGSQTVTTADSFTEGATLHIGGKFNQIYTENSVKKLLFPFSGTSGAQSATLYGDVVVLDSTVSQVLDEVFIADGRRLTHRNNRADLLTGVKEFPDYGRRLRWDIGKPTTGGPLNYTVEDCILTGATSHSHVRRLRVMPLPNAATSITFDVRLRAPTIVVADLGTDASDSTKTIAIPDDYMESLFRPLFLKRWSGSPWFRDDAARKMIAENAAEAEALLAEFTSQQKRNRRLTAPI